MEATCTAFGCVGQPKVKGLCKLHYQRLYRTGSIETRPRPTSPPCSIPDCDRTSLARGMCNLHYTRVAKHGDALTVLPTASDRRGPESPLWKANRFGYSGAHDRVRSERGSAGGHSYSKCGKRAHEWGYDHADPNELTAIVRRRGKDELVAYSSDPAHYVPFCRRCHWEFDHPGGTRHGWRHISAG